jgi:hypothetical protein
MFFKLVQRFNDPCLIHVHLWLCCKLMSFVNSIRDRGFEKKNIFYLLLNNICIKYYYTNNRGFNFRKENSFISTKK